MASGSWQPKRAKCQHGKESVANSHPPICPCLTARSGRGFLFFGRQLRSVIEAEPLAIFRPKSNCPLKAREPGQRVGAAGNNGRENELIFDQSVENEVWKNVKIFPAQLGHRRSSEVKQVSSTARGSLDGVHCSIQLLPESGGETGRNPRIIGLKF